MCVQCVFSPLVEKLDSFASLFAQKLGLGGPLSRGRQGRPASAAFYGQQMKKSDHPNTEIGFCNVQNHKGPGSQKFISSTIYKMIFGWLQKFC